jgi:hypothetical protein
VLTKYSDNNCSTSESVEDHSDLESIWSSGSSASSVSSHGSVVAKVALYELVKVLITHDSLRLLLAEAAGRASTEKFHTHVGGFLQVYGDNLEAEAENEAHIQAAIFIRQSAKSTAILIRAIMVGVAPLDRLDVATVEGRGRLDHLLGSLSSEVPTSPAVEDPQDDDSKFQNLEFMQEFLTTARAFTILCTSLRGWLRLECKDPSVENEPADEQSEETIDHAQNDEAVVELADRVNWWSRLRYLLLNTYPLPPSDCRRVLYVCVGYIAD